MQCQQSIDHIRSGSTIKGNTSLYMEGSSSPQNKSYTFGITALSRETPGVLRITDVVENTCEEFPVKYDVLMNGRKYATDSERDYVLQRRDT